VITFVYNKLDVMQLVYRYDCQWQFGSTIRVLTVTLIFLFVYLFIYEHSFVILYCRNVIPAADSRGFASFPVEQLGSDSVTSPVPGSNAVAHCSSSIKNVTSDKTLASGKNMSSDELNKSARAIHLSRYQKTSADNVCRNIRSSKQLPAKTRIRRTQLNMLADNLSKFYAPSISGNRREMLAQRRSAVLEERSARERQLEVIRKQVSLVEKRKKAELEVAAAASRSGVPEQDSRSTCATDAVTTDSASKRKSASVRFNANLSRKLGRWKSMHRRYLVQHKQKLSRGSAEISSHSESMLFACCVNSSVSILAVFG